MSISKRLRAEIMRRDNYTCRYCGASAPEVRITLDHVTPVALGGSDDPTNLVTCCADCNSGKSATPPDAPIVEDVRQDAIRWAAAMKEAARITEERQARIDDADRIIDELWCDLLMDWRGVPRPRPAGWRTTLQQFRTAGLPDSEIVTAIEITAGKTDLYNDGHWRYFCGVCWRKIDKLQQMAHALLEVEEAGGEPG